MSEQKVPHVVIVGGGFGGIRAAQALRKVPVRVTLVDRRNFHLFQPLLYQVATGALSPANIAAPLRSILRKQKNTTVLLGEVVGLDPAARKLRLRGSEIEYDYLIVATGARHHYFGHPEWERQAPGLKTLEDATEIRRRVLLAFEEAEREPDPAKVPALLTFAVIGAGPTGVELAGAIAEVAHKTLRHDFRRVSPCNSRILLIEAGPRVLPSYPEKLSAKAEQALREMGVEVRTGVSVTDVRPGVVTLKTPGGTEELSCRTVLWGAGVQASPLGKALAEALGKPDLLDRVGRVMVDPDCTVPGHPEIFVIGDLAHFSHQTGKPLPGVAQVAMQMGEFVARTIRARVLGRVPEPGFVYRDHGNMATIGASRAVADLGWLKLSGMLAWMAWLFIHLLYIVTFQNRLLILTQWAWNYFTRGRSARLITTTWEETLPPEAKPGNKAPVEAGDGRVTPPLAHAGEPAR